MAVEKLRTCKWCRRAIAPSPIRRGYWWHIDDGNGVCVTDRVRRAYPEVK